MHEHRTRGRRAPVDATRRTRTTYRLGLAAIGEHEWLAGLARRKLRELIDESDGTGSPTDASSVRGCAAPATTLRYLDRTT